MTKILFQALAGLALMFVVGFTHQAEAASVRSIKGVFISDTGERTEFNATEGRALIIQNAEKGLKYRMVPEVIGKDRVVFKLFDANMPAAQAQQVDAIELKTDGQMRSSIGVPFALAVLGVEEKASKAEGFAQPKPGDMSAQKALPGGGGSCCVSCGGWTVCCEPAPGWCCTVSSSCNNSCTACSAAEAN